MRKTLYCVMLALVLAIGAQNRAARAEDGPWGWLWGHQDPRLTAAEIVVGAGTLALGYELTRHHGHSAHIIGPKVGWGTAYGLTTAVCFALTPIVGTIFLQRALTVREAWMGFGDCVIPFIGGWIVDSAFRGQAWYEVGSEPEHHEWHHHRHDHP